MVHRWVHPSALVATALLILGCAASVPATPAVLGAWQARPFHDLDQGLARAAEAACRDETPQADGLPVVLHDQRGGGVDTVLFASPAGQATCQVSGASDGSVTWLTSGASNGPPTDVPGPLTLRMDSMGSSSGSDVQTISDIIGRTGAGVVRVRILLSDGRELEASTSAGWFYAWWPGDATAATLSGDDASGRMVASVTP